MNDITAATATAPQSGANEKDFILSSAIRDMCYRAAEHCPADGIYSKIDVHLVCVNQLCGSRTAEHKSRPTNSSAEQFVEAAGYAYGSA